MLLHPALFAGSKTGTLMDADSPRKMSATKIKVLAGLERLEASEQTWRVIQDQIAKVLADEASDLADQVADHNNWSDEDFERMARRHMRTPYTP